jgi:hypothetical protein
VADAQAMASSPTLFVAVATSAPADATAGAELIGAIEPAESAASASADIASASPDIESSHRVVESPVTVWVKLPIAKPLPQAGAKKKSKPQTSTARAKRPVSQPAPAHDPFRMIFPNPRHKFDSPPAWPNKGRAAGIYVPNH